MPLTNSPLTEPPFSNPRRLAPNPTIQAPTPPPPLRPHLLIPVRRDARHILQPPVLLLQPLPQRLLRRRPGPVLARAERPDNPGTLCPTSSSDPRSSRFMMRTIHATCTPQGAASSRGRVHPSTGQAWRGSQCKAEEEARGRRQAGVAHSWAAQYWDSGWRRGSRVRGEEQASRVQAWTAQREAPVLALLFDFHVTAVSRTHLYRVYRPSQKDASIVASF
ncbi:unnamed protein product [Parascedosporium putredinis]|uniref:Uncharacterized protein n=1 Tax=Parascedosporium putredinis TaxID=1442378 RepID=A0A9P1HBS3_9PEZI|nr:unnamed protein product [Parascedosporium putredinis]CAI8004169.1 unnamed protein product [Parascedosporium putredinis]